MKGNKLKIITIILAIILVCLVSFIGVYVQTQNRMENKVKDYLLGMNLKGSRNVILKVSEATDTVVKDAEGNVIKDATDEEIEKNGYTKEEVPVNGEEVLTEENYNKTKKILEERLKKLGAESYNIRINPQDGTIMLELSEDDNTDYIVSNVSQTGKFTITDSKDTDNILMNNDDIKTAKVLYNTSTNGTSVYLDIEFNKEGTKKLEEISKQYATKEESQEDTTTDETTEETSEEASEETSEGTSEENSTETSTEETTEETQKEITMSIDESALITTSFDETITNGTIQMSIGQPSTDYEKLQDNIQNVTTITTLLDTEKLPIEYTINGNEYIQSNITSEIIIKIAIVSAIILAIALVLLIIKYKTLGLLSSISFIGLIAVYLLTIRYTNVQLTIESISGIILILILNYILNKSILKKIKEDDESSNIIKDSFLEFLLKIIPVCIISIVFCFIKWTAINTFGMTMFWGIVIIFIYNLIITRALLNSKAKK